MIFRSTKYTVGTSYFLITAEPQCVRDAITRLYTQEEYKLITCLSFPTITTLLPVALSINGKIIPVQDSSGNTLMSDQIKSRRCYRMNFGSNPSHFILKQCVSTSQAAPTSVSVLTTEPVTESEVTNVSRTY